MKDLRNIKTRKGDIIYFKDGRTVAVNDWAEIFYNYGELEDKNDKIIKIERPIQYKTIYEAPKQILDKEEKEYLENLIRPFWDRVENVVKYSACGNKEYLTISIQGDTSICLPCFSAGSMYRRMKALKVYSIYELGLFREE